MGIVKETRELAPYGCYATINHTENQVNKKEENVTDIHLDSCISALGHGLRLRSGGEVRVDGELFCKDDEFVV